MLNPSLRVVFSPDYWQALSGIEKSFRLVHFEYVDRNKSNFNNLASLAINGMIQGLDRHSQFFEAEEYKSFQENTKRSYVGIGIMIRNNSQGVVVTRVFKDSPANIAGLKVGDIITHVNEQSIEGQDLEQVSIMIKGIEGSEVIIRKLDFSGISKTLTVTRTEIQVASVDCIKIDQNGTGYLHITQFTERTGKEVKSCLEKFLDKGLTRLIVDLRDNSGGLLNGAVEVIQLFVPAGEQILTIKGRDDAGRREFRSKIEGKFVDLPLVILLNEKSASASEIVAGSLSKSKRATLVGETSYGKGSVQTIFPLSNGCGMKLTTAMYYFIDGSTADGKGVEPDHYVPCSEQNETKLSLQRYAGGIQSQDRFEELFGFSKIEDEQLRFAKKVVVDLKVRTP